MDFIADRTKRTKELPPGGTISLLTHLTYFGYCFNPISVFYCLRPDSVEGSILKTSNDESEKQDQSGNQNNSRNQMGIIKSDEKKLSLVSTASPHISKIESIIVEVSNTPWIEQHSYMLDESVEHVRHHGIFFSLTIKCSIPLHPSYILIKLQNEHESSSISGISIWFCLTISISFLCPTSESVYCFLFTDE